MVHTVNRQLPGSQAELGGQFHPGCTGTYDGDWQFVAVSGTGFVVLAQKGIEHQVMETPRLVQAVQEQAVVLGTGGSEVIGVTAHGNHQGVVANAALGHHFIALLVKEGGNNDLPGTAVKPAHAAQLKFIMVLAGVGPVIDLVGAGIQGARRHFVQQGFPDVGQAGIHQGDTGLLFLSQFVAKAGDQLKTARAATYDDDVMQIFHYKRFLK